jgi:high-affinity Fe2+/Pb2+ permease
MTMSRPIRILLVLVSIIVGYILMYWGYSTSLPSYIGEWVCLAGMILVISGGIYALVRIVKKMKKSIRDGDYS